MSSNIFYGASNVYATGNQAGLYPAESIDTEQDMREFKQMLGAVERYIYNNGSMLFDEQEARLNNENEDIIQIGLAYNEMYIDEQLGNFEKVNRRKIAVISGLTHYGNWCGEGNNGEDPIDILDAQCKKHDLCYEQKGMWNDSCDVDLVYNIVRNFRAINKIGWHARTYAVAAVVIFAGKVGGTERLKLSYPELAPYLP